MNSCRLVLLPSSRSGEATDDAVSVALGARADHLLEQCAALVQRAAVLRARAATPGCTLHTSLTDLPDEATLAVLRLLPTGSLVVAGAVCVAWRAAAQHPSLWERVQVDCLTMGQDALRHLTRKSAHRNVKTLIITGQLQASLQCQTTEDEPQLWWTRDLEQPRHTGLCSGCG